MWAFLMVQWDLISSVCNFLTVHFFFGVIKCGCELHTHVSTSMRKVSEMLTARAKSAQCEITLLFILLILQQTGVYTLMRMRFVWIVMGFIVCLKVFFFLLEQDITSFASSPWTACWCSSSRRATRLDAFCPGFYSQALCVTVPELTPSSPSPRLDRWSVTGQIIGNIIFILF